eukprot:913488-Rhodomonas_salina.2
MSRVPCLCLSTPCDSKRDRCCPSGRRGLAIPSDAQNWPLSRCFSLETVTARPRLSTRVFTDNTRTPPQRFCAMPPSHPHCFLPPDPRPETPPPAPSLACQHGSVVASAPDIESAR